MDCLLVLLLVASKDLWKESVKVDRSVKLSEVSLDSIAAGTKEY